MERVTADGVLNRMKKEEDVLNTIEIIKLHYLGHIMRGRVEKEERRKIVGKRSVGR